MCSHTVAIKVEKDGYTFKNQFTTTNYPSAIHAPFLKIGLLPRILAPQIGEVITLPYEKYRLDLKTILSVAVLQQSDGYTRYLVPLQDGIIINHPDDLLHGEDFTSCILDQRTVVTFDSTWATPRQSLPNTTTPDYQLPSGTWTQSNIWNPSLSIYPVTSSSSSQT